MKRRKLVTLCNRKSDRIMPRILLLLLFGFSVQFAQGQELPRQGENSRAQFENLLQAAPYAIEGKIVATHSFRSTHNTGAGIFTACTLAVARIYKAPNDGRVSGGTDTLLIVIPGGQVGSVGTHSDHGARIGAPMEGLFLLKAIEDGGLPTPTGIAANIGCFQLHSSTQFGLAYHGGHHSNAPVRGCGTYFDTPEEYRAYMDRQALSTPATRSNKQLVIEPKKPIKKRLESDAARREEAKQAEEAARTEAAATAKKKRCLQKRKKQDNGTVTE